VSVSTIVIDDRGVRRTLANGSEEQVSWDGLLEVSVLTTSDGPFAEDVFFVLVGRDDTGCVIPQSSPESAQLLERLQRLPGFDNEAIIRAMSSTEDARFLCWRRTPQVDRPGQAGEPGRPHPPDE
jgi:hypothetical protein